jgi:cobalt-zinc-cadmium resistance protein CzcA
MEKFLIKIIQKKILVCSIFGLCFIAGIISFLRLPIDAFPDLTNNQVQILVEAPGMAPIEVEEQITIPIEAMMNGLPKVQEIRSISKFGVSVITVIFEDQVNIYFARQIVNEKLQNAKSKLPTGINTELGPIVSGMGEIFQYIVSGNGYSVTELKAIQDWEIKYRLKSVAGINEVNTWGGFNQEYQVIISPEKLMQHQLSLKEVFSALQNNNENFSGGIIEHHAEQYLIRGLGKIQTLEDIRNILIKQEGRSPVTIKDVAEVEFTDAFRQGAVTKDGKGEVVTGIVMMLRGENSSDVIKRVKEKIAEINKTLPESVKIKAFYDQTELIAATLKTLKANLLEGGILVIAVLLFMLGNLRAALIVALSIPISLMFSFMGMKALGITANIMSLGAIDFGMIVDGAIVMVENTMRRLAHPEKEISSQEIINESVREMAKPILFGVLIITIVYLPILSLEGIEYKMFSPMVFTVCFALLGSLITALVLVPVLCSYFMKIHIVEKENILINKIKQPYINFLKRCIEKPRKLITISVSLFIVSCLSIPFLGTEFIPKLDEGDLLIEVRHFSSIALDEALINTSLIESIIKKIPEVKEVVSKTGRPDLATDPMSVFMSDMFISLEPKHKWRVGLTKDKLIKEINDKLDKNIIGTRFNFTQPIAMRVDELVSGVRSDLAIKLFGKDLNVLIKKAAEIEAALKKVPGQNDLQVEKLTGSKQVTVNPDRNLMALYGVSVNDIRTAISTAILGTPVAEILENKKRFALRVKFPSELDINPHNLENLLVETASQEKIPLSQVAKIEVSDSTETINREFGERRIIIQMNVRGRDMGSFVKEAKSIIAKEVKLGSGYYLEWGGQFKNQERAMKKLLIVVPLAIMIIFGLLVLSFSSSTDALIVLINVPFALIGGILALWLRSLYLSVPAVIGFIALFGVAVLNGLVLISTIKKLREENQEEESGEKLNQILIHAAESRLRPVLMTATVAILGFLPMALSHGAGAEVQRPLASVVIGGLLSSTLLTLVLLPVVYKMVYGRNLKKSSF